MGTSSAANGWGITVFRGSTCILTVHDSNAEGGTQPGQCNINVLDSPSSSSAVTYSVRAGCMAGSSAIFIQRRGTEKYNNTMALNSVTLQEIGSLIMPFVTVDANNKIVSEHGATNNRDNRSCN